MSLKQEDDDLSSNAKAQYSGLPSSRMQWEYHTSCTVATFDAQSLQAQRPSLESLERCETTIFRRSVPSSRDAMASIHDASHRFLAHAGVNSDFILKNGESFALLGRSVRFEGHERE